MLDQFICAEQGSNILCLCHKISILDFKSCIYNLHFTGPLGLITGYLDLGTGSQFLVILLGACHIVKEITAVLILCINGSLILPPGLLCLYISLNCNLCVKVCCHILFISHNAFGLYILSAVRAFGRTTADAGKYQCQS